MNDNDADDVLFKEMLLVPDGPPDVVWQVALDTVFADVAVGGDLSLSNGRELADAAGADAYGVPSEDFGSGRDTDLETGDGARGLADSAGIGSEWTTEPEDGYGL